MYQPDLTRRGEVITVGYLARGHPFTKGKASKTFFDCLVALVARPLYAWCGYHTCDVGWCGLFPKGGHPTFRYKGRVVSVGSTDVLVPDNDVVYEAPSLILHYIWHHKYLPPECFVQAVQRCPDPGSLEYLTAIKNIAPQKAHLLEG